MLMTMNKNPRTKTTLVRASITRHRNSLLKKYVPVLHSISRAQEIDIPTCKMNSLASIQCFDTADWVTGSAFNLKNTTSINPKDPLLGHQAQPVVTVEKKVS